MYEDCENCNGTGEYCIECMCSSDRCSCEEYDLVICEECHGTGEIEN